MLSKWRQRRSLYSKSLSGKVIRILTLLPGSQGDPIKCQLRETLLQDSGPYKALSYTWNTGDDDGPPVSITCNKVTINISSNLYLALQQLRNDRIAIEIWIDSICINQKNNDERTYQVGIMREIYARSTEVIIWLGESGPHDHLGEAVMRILSAEDREHLYQWHGDGRDLPKLKAYVSKEAEAYRKSDPAGDEVVDVFGALYVLHAFVSGMEASSIQELRHFSKTGPILKGFDALMHQRWWSRAWVVQEVVVAQSAIIRYGKLSAPWKFFSQAASQYEKGRLEAHADSVYPYVKEQSLARFSRKILEIDTTRNDWNLAEPVGLLPLLRKFRSRSVSDERDKVFALLGLVRFWRINEMKILPDYHLKGTEVSFATTKSLLASVGSLSVLAGTLRQNERYDSNPSWVIDWNCPLTLTEDTRLQNLLWYNAGGSVGSIELHKQRMLKIEGCFLDDVLCVSEELVDTTITRMRLVIQSWADLFYSAGTSRSSLINYSGGGLGPDAFWRTVCGDLEYVRTGQNTIHGIKEGFRQASPEGRTAFENFRFADYNYRRTTSIIGGLWQEVNAPNPDIARSNAFHRAVECASQGRRFFVTKAGYIGVGPRNMGTGDCVFVVHGSQVPFILRTANEASRTCKNERIETLSSATASQPTYMPAGKDAKVPERKKTCNETHLDLYFAIGDAYVHGIMNGEALRKGSLAYRIPQSISLI